MYSASEKRQMRRVDRRLRASRPATPRILRRARTERAVLARVADHERKPDGWAELDAMRAAAEGGPLEKDSDESESDSDYESSTDEDDSSEEEEEEEEVDNDGEEYDERLSSSGPETTTRI
ncbi:hypothetical protein PG994_009929 [Apiospora phragmitis]|uniref:Uncharacterized protein n=1 Tax=Apiospora phragmitis TaxID=2905665 RepID=A0ABR1TR18_9PEZI